MSSDPWKLILASQSPRRRQLLTEAGYRFEVIPPSELAEDVSADGLTPGELVRRLAYRKAVDVAGRIDAGLIVACDTVAECCGRILGKPQDRRDAWRMLSLLRGRSHHVYSGLCLMRRPDGKTLLHVDATKLYMEEISDSELQRYLDSGAWRGKAGAFGYQDRLGWLRIVCGSESNVVGLPLELLERLLPQIVAQP